MSVSFGPAFCELGAEWVVVCSCGSVRNSEVYGSREELRGVLDTMYKNGVRSKCEDIYCVSDGLGWIQKTVEDPEVSLSNANAATLLDVLGIKVGEDFSERCTGVLDANDFLGRILVARALSPVDAGVPAFQEGNMIDCGRVEGYVDTRLAELESVAIWSRERNLQIVWG